MLFEFDAVADAIGSVQEHADEKGEIGLTSKEADRLLDVVVKYFEIFLFEIGDELVSATENGEENIDQVNCSDDGLVDARWSLLALGRVRLCRRGRLRTGTRLRSGGAWRLLRAAGDGRPQKSEGEKKGNERAAHFAWL